MSGQLRPVAWSTRKTQGQESLPCGHRFSHRRHSPYCEEVMMLDTERQLSAIAVLASSNFHNTDLSGLLVVAMLGSLYVWEQVRLRSNSTGFVQQQRLYPTTELYPTTYALSSNIGLVQQPKLFPTSRACRVRLWWLCS
jgi:hypothetical protein